MRFHELDQFRIALLVLDRLIGQAFLDRGPVVGDVVGVLVGPLVAKDTMQSVIKIGVANRVRLV